MKKMIATLIATTPIAFGLLLGGCSNPAENVTEAKVQPAKAAAESTAGKPVKPYQLDQASKIEFTGSKVTGKHDGGFNKFSGTFGTRDGKLVAEGSRFEIDMTSTWSDAEKLTGHLLSPDFFDAEQYPKSIFAVTEVTEKDGETLITGNLNFHGVEKSITFPAEVQVTDTAVSLKSTFYIKRFDFNVKYPGRANDLIRDEVVIRLDVSAKAG